ncbi:DinB family protein [Chondrinema litorale]|uniref:DinB family protein n=1 Tax=Chondrinema litorale TaxID=2994555 RepID=UPI0025433D6E|nr:DinB family protein [Chondrinema litorale]UZR99339.1 DinB family protein [Chondrinema litorale]
MQANFEKKEIMNKNSYTQVYSNISQKDLLKILNDQVEEQLYTVKNEFLELSDESLLARPEASKWNILECIEHLNRYCAFYIPHIEIVTNQNEKSGKNFQSGWLGTKFTQMMSPENIKPQKTVKHMDTSDALVNKNTLLVFIAWQQRLFKAINELKNTDLNKRKIPVEFFKMLKLKTGDILQFLIMHQQRHILQALDKKDKLKSSEVQINI